MFKVGEEYEFCTLTNTEDGLCETKQQWQIAAIDGTLLHLHNPAKAIEKPWSPEPVEIPEENMVLNTASAFFHSATRKTE